MKKIVFLFFAFPFVSIGQMLHEQVIKSEIKKVKLYLTAGEMLHEQSVKLVKGRNKIIFSGISAYADPQSIQFSAEGKFRLVSVSTEMDFLAAEQFNPKISQLQDSLELIKDYYQANQDMIQAFHSELSVLETNKALKGANSNLNVQQIKEAAEYFRSRTLEINQKMFKLKKEQAKYNVKIEKLRYQLVELNFVENQRSNQVIILLDSEESLAVNCKLVYLVSDCGWAAAYDLAANDLNQKVNLKYKAKIYNNTGNEWKDVDITLSTGDPHLTASHPELDPWYLSYVSQVAKMDQGRSNYYAPQVQQQDYRESAWQNVNMANQRAYDNYVLEDSDAKQGLMDLSLSKTSSINNFAGNSGKKQVKSSFKVNMKNIEISDLSTEFVISSKFSCPSDAKPYTIEVKEMILDATFSHISVPKLDNGSFLMAHIVGWQDLELIPGPTNVYFAGMYVGVSEIDTRNVEDTLSLSFGRDGKVMVMRKLKKEMSSKRVAGNSKKDSYVYEIAVRNNRNVPVKVNLFDQVPIARSSEIVVSVDQLSGAVKDEVTGEVVWEINLQPGEVKTFDFGFSVKYPKDAKITVKSFRTISAPAF
jgi:hypothetical protein